MIVTQMCANLIIGVYFRDAQHTGKNALSWRKTCSKWPCSVHSLNGIYSVIIPVQAHYLSAIGMTQLLQTVNRVKRFTNPKLKVDGILLTMVDRRTNLSKEVGEIIRTSYGGKIQVYQSQIPMSVRAAEMSYTGKSIYEYDPKGAVAEAYEAFTKEVMRDAEKERAKVRDTECR